MRAAELKSGNFFGQVTRRHVCAGVTISEICHPGARCVPLHSHESAYFSLLLGGGYRETFGRRTIQYGLHTISFHPPGTVHRGEFDASGGRMLAIELPHTWLDRVRDFAPPPAFSHYRAGGPLAWLAFRLHREYRRSDAASPLIIEGILLEMLAEVSRRRPCDDSADPAWLAVAVELLRAEFQRSLTLGEVARRVCVHPAHLSRVFRRKYRQTVGEFVNELRVRYAIERMAHDVPLSELSLAAGFADQSHFTRVFRAHTGSTPARFRASNGSRPRPANRNSRLLHS
jgi:AraC family transcriptional regulator